MLLTDSRLMHGFRFPFGAFPSFDTSWVFPSTWWYGFDKDENGWFYWADGGWNGNPFYKNYEIALCKYRYPFTLFILMLFAVLFLISIVCVIYSLRKRSGRCVGLSAIATMFAGLGVRWFWHCWWSVSPSRRLIHRIFCVDMAIPALAVAGRFGMCLWAFVSPVILLAPSIVLLIRVAQCVCEKFGEG